MLGGGSLHSSTAETAAAKMHYVRQESGALFKVAVCKVSEFSKALLTRIGLTAVDVDLSKPHRANERIILATVELLSMPKDKIVINTGECGNTTARSIPPAMHTALEEGRLKKGTTVLPSFGGGYTIGSTLLRGE